MYFAIGLMRGLTPGAAKLPITRAASASSAIELTKRVLTCLSWELLASARPSAEGEGRPFHVGCSVDSRPSTFRVPRFDICEDMVCRWLENG